MRILAGVSALALTLAMVSVEPASAQAYDDVYVKDGYGYDRSDMYHRTALMTRGELRREVEEQGYYDVTDLRPSSFGGVWQATAYIDGELVSITIDPYDGRVLTANEI